ncbi:hypothetical protein BABINDRAFT_109771 [Babjeviella inositovora NRRL Y-12698]|uniref:Mitochondrial inner membrane protease subunit n=1 Tax=Babjeviella inositovora NRRL Y-12698 TaxID=984486 RepID=A0A1E3QVJ9_9ASCO|nr:uncharacterized protein BABINDRAFT_109771 [Babjeviella inositovora NRRL Y-12698]ODQ81644.1 hypothetical protein BABINDRAFT_109771 [Babjeviella inositovora NRRL Y-12698]
MSFWGPQTASYLKVSLTLLSWVPVAFTFQSHVYDITQVKGASMVPTFNPPEGVSNDFVLVHKFNLRHSLKVNDVVLFRSPTNPEQVYVKRIKGLQGDTVIAKHPYPKRQVQVPRNHIWVEGDNSSLTVDSNNFGPISNGLVIGRCEKIIWPVSRWGNVRGYGGREARERMLRGIESIEDV